MDVNYELKAVEGYLPSIEKTLAMLHSDARLEKLKKANDGVNKEQEEEEFFEEKNNIEDDDDEDVIFS